ncbi:MAG: YafY family protein [Pseudomonadota bacterium]
MARTERIFNLMQALRSMPPPVTAAALAEALGVTPRTIYRDIETLRNMGAVIDGEAGFGYLLIEDASMPPLNFDDAELEAVVLGLRDIAQVNEIGLADAAKSALTKLRARLPQSQSHRIDYPVHGAKRYFSLPEPGIDADTLRRATWEERSIQFDYTDAEGKQTVREVDPLLVAMMDTSLCLLAFCHLRQDFRAFRLDRMRNLELTGLSFRPRRAPMLRDCLKKMG